MSRCAVVEETQMPFRSVDLLGLSPESWGNSMATNLNRPRTADDDKRLLEMRASGRSNISIWAALKRSQSAVRARISILRERGQDEPPSGASPEIKRGR